VSTVTLLLAPRQLGSQEGSSSTLSQSDSTRDLARFTQPRASARHPLRLASYPFVPPSLVLIAVTSVDGSRSDAQTVATASQRLISV